MTDWNAFQAGVIGLVIIALLVGATSIALDSFQNDLGSNACPTGYTYNTSGRECCGTNATGITTSYCRSSSVTGGNRTGGTTAFNSTQEGLTGSLNATNYLSTIGTLIGVAMLIAIVTSAFYFVARR